MRLASAQRDLIEKVTSARGNLGVKPAEVDAGSHCKRGSTKEPAEALVELPQFSVNGGFIKFVWVEIRIVLFVEISLSTR